MFSINIHSNHGWPGWIESKIKTKLSQKTFEKSSHILKVPCRLCIPEEISR